MNRRFFIKYSLTGLLATLVAGPILLKPKDKGKPYTPYFAQINKLLKDNNIAKPSLIVDLDLLDENIDTLLHYTGGPSKYRIVTKSLPSIEMIKYIANKSTSNKVMAFHRPFLHQIAHEMPKADVLLGKPMPTAEVENFYRNFERNITTFRPEKQIQWLVDSKERLQQYLALAKKINEKFLVNIEIDVGLHRGGVNGSELFIKLLNIINNNAQYLELSGLMGYDPHVTKLPAILGSTEKLFEDSQNIYKKFIGLSKHYSQNETKNLCFNGAGSPTITLHANNTVSNDISAGSCLLKPTDFDDKLLAKFKPASFISTPVIKHHDGPLLPGAKKIDDIISWWDPNKRRNLFVYGGYWKAKYIAPEGISTNNLYGRSSNQELINASSSVKLAIDDNVFLRPSQSESVLLQFGDILAIRGNKIEKLWSPFKA